jgi:hypothetical protein
VLGAWHVTLLLGARFLRLRARALSAVAGRLMRRNRSYRSGSRRLQIGGGRSASHARGTPTGHALSIAPQTLPPAPPPAPSCQGCLHSGQRRAGCCTMPSLRCAVRRATRVFSLPRTRASWDQHGGAEPQAPTTAMLAHALAPPCSAPRCPAPVSWCPLPPRSPSHGGGCSRRYSRQTASLRRTRRRRRCKLRSLRSPFGR